MREYDKNDFITYYSGSFVRHPDFPGSVGRIINDRNADVIRFYQGDSVDSLTAAQMAQIPTINHRELDWEHVRRPPLGYRHLENGKYLFYAYIERSHGTPKGIHQRIINISCPIEFRAIVNSLKHAYPPDRRLNVAEAKELCFPSFVPSVREAVTRLTKEPEALGFAINCDVAILLGLREHETFIMLLREDKAAISRDGKRWEVTSREFDGVLGRHLKLGDANA